MSFLNWDAFILEILFQDVLKKKLSEAPLLQPQTSVEEPKRERRRVRFSIYLFIAVYLYMIKNNSLQFPKKLLKIKIYKKFFYLNRWMARYVNGTLPN